MMRLETVFWVTAVAGLLVPCVHGADAGTAARYQLRLIAQFKTAQVGEEVQYTLVIEGKGVRDILGHDSTIEAGSTPVGVNWVPEFRFVMPFAIRPTKEGTQIIGPFKLQFQGETLTSGSARLEVFPDWGKQEEGIRIQVSSDHPVVGEPLEFVIRRRSRKADFGLMHTQFFDNSRMRIDHCSSEETSLREPGYHEYVWRCRFLPKRPGRLEIKREDFQGLPADIPWKALVFDVREASSREPSSDKIERKQ